MKLIQISVEFHGDGSPHTVTSEPYDTFELALAAFLWECAHLHGALVDAETFANHSAEIIEHAYEARASDDGVAERSDLCDPECNFTLTIQQVPVPCVSSITATNSTVPSDSSSAT
jgi:hypothetical protein